MSEGRKQRIVGYWRLGVDWISTSIECNNLLRRREMHRLILDGSISRNQSRTWETVWNVLFHCKGLGLAEFSLTERRWLKGHDDNSVEARKCCCLFCEHQHTVFRLFQIQKHTSEVLLVLFAVFTPKIVVVECSLGGFLFLVPQQAAF